MSALTSESPEDLAALEAGLGVLRVMDPTGDTRIMWDPARPDEVAVARAAFADAIARGMRGYKVKRNGDPGSVISAFPEEAGKVILAPALRGG